MLSQGTVREDYSGNGDAWTHFPHESARSRTFRWGEDGIAGLCDNHGRLGFSLAFWNGKDRMLKERLFGLANNEGASGCVERECDALLTPRHQATTARTSRSSTGTSTTRPRTAT